MCVCGEINERHSTDRWSTLETVGFGKIVARAMAQHFVRRRRVFLFPFNRNRHRPRPQPQLHQLLCNIVCNVIDELLNFGPMLLRFETHTPIHLRRVTLAHVTSLQMPRVPPMKHGIQLVALGHAQRLL